MTMATSHRSAGVLSDRNCLEDAPARRTRAVGETCRAGTCRAPWDKNEARPPARRICHAVGGSVSSPARRSRPCACGRPLSSVRPR
ncbi:hypothetical protein BC826DRAFT_1023733 [Russula brevipes]|nr:hypothetical protein BC826DRAFT_1023733 [Russula brevipes]